MSDLLSREEIEALAISHRANNSMNVLNGDYAKQIRVYDFARPDKFSKDHLRALNLIHSKYGMMFASGIGSLLKASAKIKLLTMEQITYYEYNASLPKGTMLVEVSLHKHMTQAIFEFNQAFVATCVEILTGGKTNAQASNVDLTEVDCAIMAPIVESALINYAKAWSSCVSFHLRAGKVSIGTDVNPVMMPEESVLVCNYEVVLGDLVAMFSICLPATALEPILPSLSLSKILNASSKKSDDSDADLRNSVNSVKLRCRAVLGDVNVTMNELVSLEVGDVLKLNRYSTEPVELWVENMPAFSAKIGVSRGNLAVKVQEKIVDLEAA